MTLAEVSLLANLTLNVITCAVVVVGFFWLKNIQNAQLGSLEAVIKEKDARIARLEADAAPAIVKDYEILRGYANKRAEEAQKLTNRIEVLRKAHLQTSKLDTATILLSEGSGIAMAASLLEEPFGLLAQCTGEETHQKVTEQLIDEVIKVYGQMTELVAAKNKEAERVLATVKTGMAQ